MYRLDTGQEIELGRKLGEGAEGTVHLAENLPGQAVKIWKDGQGGRETARKVKAMLSRPPDGDGRAGAAWPTALVTDGTGVPTGFAMPALDHMRHRSVFNYFNPASRDRLQRSVSRKNLLTVSRNLALAVDSIHRAGHVIGDVNEKNTMVGNRLEVVLVDADSMQVTDPDSGRTYRCTKGRDDYTPPRLQGQAFRDHDRTREDDLFGLAALVFKLLMEGVHPFASTADPDTARGITLGEKIKREYFPYNESGTTPREHRPSLAYQEAWMDLDFNLRHLFRRAFDPDAGSLGGRPSPGEWVRELERVMERPPPARERPRRSAEGRTGPDWKRAADERHRADQAARAARAGQTGRTAQPSRTARSGGNAPATPANPQAQGARFNTLKIITYAIAVVIAVVVFAKIAPLILDTLSAQVGTSPGAVEQTEEPAGGPAREEPAGEPAREPAPAPTPGAEGKNAPPEHALMCDQLLMRELILQRDAVEAEAVNSLAAGIQKDRAECAPEVWDPRAEPRVNHSDPGGCFRDAWDAGGRYASVGETGVPPGLRDEGDPLGRVQSTTGRDAVNNIIVYWGEKTPGDGANCWLYVESLDKSVIPAWASGPERTR